MGLDVHCYPTSDEDFATFVNDVVHAHASIPTARLMADIETDVRRLYPNAQFVARDEFGGYDTDPVWYAYRDGRIRAANPQRERLYASLSRARTTVEKADEALDESRETARRAGY